MFFLPRFEMAGEPGLQRAVFLLRLRNQLAHQELFERLRRQVPLKHAADGDRNRARLLGDDDDDGIGDLADADARAMARAEVAADIVDIIGRYVSEDR